MEGSIINHQLLRDLHISERSLSAKNAVFKC